MNYLYNGVELPDIYSVVDRDTHPYLVMRQSAAGAFVCVCMSEVPVISEIDSSVGTLWLGPEGNGIVVCKIIDGSWEVIRETEGGNGFYPIIGGLSVIFWVSFDLYYADDIVDSGGGEAPSGVAFYASDPIPVNPPNPTAMLMGYMVGQAIRK